VAALIGFLAHRESERFKNKNGVTPWHWPSWVWAVVGFMLGLIGALVLFVSTRTTKPVSGAQPGTTPLQPGAMAGTSETPKPDPIPAFVGAAGASGEGSGTETVTGPSHAAPAAHATHPPAWLNDPTGRFASRYWTGSLWTEHVSDGSSTTTDPL
jgi:hypothetical protein